MNKLLKFQFFTAFLSLLIMSQLTWADDKLKASLFNQADSLAQKAEEVNAKILAPVSYDKAIKSYDKAKSRYERNQSVAKIQKDLTDAENGFSSALEAAKLAELTFETTIRARNDAMSVESANLAKSKWLEGERLFLEATTTLEIGNIKKARKKADDAEKKYREAELTAIKGNYLNLTREKISEANAQRVEKYAPKTLKKASELLLSAEKELTENRYDIDYPRSLAKQSLYEAKHSLYLASQVKRYKDKDETVEDLLLRVEDPLINIAGELDLVASFEKGAKEPTQAIIGKIKSLQQDSYDLGELRNHVEHLEKEIAMLENRLGIQSERLALEEAQRARMNQVNNLFRRDEAVVLTQGNNILVRAVGLRFEQGSAEISPRHHALLKKMEQAIEILADYGVVIEGHTDSFGSDEQNMALSLKRAEAVRRYFITNMSNFSTSKSQAVGFGETKPIANNETREGRAKNRRIDLLFTAR